MSRAFWIALLVLQTLAIINGKVCLATYCSLLPPTRLLGPVVNVLSDDWVDLKRIQNLNESLSSVFRSTNEVCRVEVKFKGLISGVRIAFFRQGRAALDDFFIGTNDDGESNDCSFAWYFNLGTSVVSKGSELGMMFLLLNETDEYEGAASGRTFVDFWLQARQFCSNGTHVPVTTGLQLPSPKRNGPALTYNHAALGTFATYAYYQGSGSYDWSILPPPGCGLQLEFIDFNGDSSFYLEPEGIFSTLGHIGPRYLTPANLEVVVFLVLRNSPTFVHEFIFRYQADCRTKPVNLTKIIGMDAIPLKAPTIEWQQVQLTPVQIIPRKDYIWIIPGHDVQIETITKGDQYDVGLELETDIEALYPDHTVFGITTSTSASSGAQFTFKYRLRPKAVKTIIVHPTDTSGQVISAPTGNHTLTALILSGPRLAENRLEFVSSDPTCVIGLEFIVNEFIPNNLIVHPFGFVNATTNWTHGQSGSSEDETFVGMPSVRMQSFGPRLGLFLNLTRYSSTLEITVLYQARCAHRLIYSSKQPGEWERVYLVAHQPYILTRPSVLPSGKNVSRCWTEMQVVQTLEDELSYYDQYHEMDYYGTYTQTPELRATCYQERTTAQLEWFESYHTNCSSDVFLEGISLDAQLAYRLRCSGDFPVGSPIAPSGKTLIATNKKTKFNSKTGIDEFKDVRLGRAWTIETKSPKCFVRLDFKFVDTSNLGMFENREAARWNQDPRLPLRNEIVPPSFYPNVQYIACSNRVFLQSFFQRWTDPEQVRSAFVGTYQQICDERYVQELARTCGASEVRLRASGDEWRSIDLTYVNFNQVRQITFIISPDDNSSVPSQVKAGGNQTQIELQFLSLVQQTFIKYSSETRGVYVFSGDGRASRATLGRIMRYNASKEVNITADNIVRPGHHVFAARYRLVQVPEDPVMDRPTPLFADRILIATNKSQTLEFQIPKQFSSKRRAEILQSLNLGEYDPATFAHEFEHWAFRYQWLIQPQDPSQGCRAVVQFTRMDISNGYLMGTDREHNDVQHRLVVQTNTSFALGPASSLHTCLSRPSHPWYPYCARMNTPYMASNSGQGVVVLFQSASYSSEYEKPELVYDGDVYAGFGMETTWGSGWTATYQQVCSEASIHELFESHIIRVVARSKWTSSLPQVPKDESVLFLNLTWVIVPDHQECNVEFSFAARPESLLLYGPDGQYITDDVKRGTLANITLVMERKSPSFLSSRFRFRQSCAITGAPTSSPTAKPTPPALLADLPDGWACLEDTECASGKCSADSGQCVARNCVAVCRQATAFVSCRSINLPGCVCSWVAGRTPRCAPIL